MLDGRIISDDPVSQAPHHRVFITDDGTRVLAASSHVAAQHIYRDAATGTSSSETVLRAVNSSASRAAMADVLLGSERRVLISGYGLPAPAPPPPPPESLLGRLDQIDLRLRQLEEQRRPAPADDGAVVRSAQAQHHHTKSLPSALQHVRLRGTLMDRLNLLESRIRQLSCELDLDVGGGKAGAGSYATLGLGSSSSATPRPPPAEDPAWSDTAPMVEPCRDPAAATCAPASKSAAADGSWSAVEILQRGARQLHRNKSNAPSKVKNLKEAKCACQKEKRKAERGRTSRRWFTVGC